MLLGNKKTQTDEQNWSIVLNPIRNEIDKKKVAQKIAEVFSLSHEEASDLVSNTPIILLDNLTRPIAAKVKDYFKPTGAEMVLTNDVFLKRKCYRTVWPEQPSLAFLHGWDTPRETQQDKQEMLDPDEALDEIRSLDKTEKDEAENEIPLDRFSNGKREQLLEDLERSRKECHNLRHEVEKLQDELERRSRENLTALSCPESESEQSLRERDRELKEARGLLSHMEEKYEVLKQEYREARSVFEEKLSLSARENEQWKIKLNELNEEVQSLRQEEQKFSQQVSAKENEYKMLVQEYGKARLSFEEGVAALRRQLGALEMALEHEKSERARFEEKQKEWQRREERFLQEVASKNFELEASRKEFNQFRASIEERERAYKKAEMMNRLAEKQARLRRLVKDQEKIEADIKDREEALRQILAEQETVERDLLEAKQAERQLSESRKEIRSGAGSRIQIHKGEAAGEES